VIVPVLIVMCVSVACYVLGGGRCRFRVWGPAGRVGGQLVAVFGGLLASGLLSLGFFAYIAVTAGLLLVVDRASIR
jgi:hypothetical protein